MLDALLLRVSMQNANSIPFALKAATPSASDAKPYASGLSDAGWKRMRPVRVSGMMKWRAAATIGWVAAPGGTLCSPYHPAKGDADRQRDLQEALLLQMDMQKRLHDQLEVLPSPPGLAFLECPCTGANNTCRIWYWERSRRHRQAGFMQ